MTGKENAGRERNGSLSKQERERERSPRGKSKPLFVKGSNIVKVDKGGGCESRKKENAVRGVSGLKGKGGK